MSFYKQQTGPTLLGKHISRPCRELLFVKIHILRFYEFYAFFLFELF